MDIKCGRKISRADFPNIGINAVLVLDQGSGDERVVAKVSVCGFPSDIEWKVTILCFDARTGSKAPNNIMVGKSMQVKTKDLRFERK